ncbi:MAG TPA: DUF72 domain-containing protein [Bryobacteraceae bacterium]|nr:DUF72 domain-containing protein [Bryobacteraceae bacterium]
MTSTSPRFGPSGWEFPQWLGVVYPKHLPRGFHPLAFLAQHFDAVEIRSTFLRVPRPEIARLWLEKVSQNRNFAFSAVLHRRFTHERALDPAEAAVFKEGLRPLLRAGRLGCLVMQFPWAFRFTAENREYLIELRRAFHEFPLVVEMRHNSWLADEALGTLIDYRLGFVNIDQPEYARAMPPTSMVTSSVAYVRLHGRDPKYWDREFGRTVSAAGQPPAGGDYLYSTGELDEWKKRIEHVSKYAAKTFVVTANDGGGKSVVNAMQLARVFASNAGRIEMPHTAVA